MAQSLAHLIIVLFIIFGNIGFFIERNKRKKLHRIKLMIFNDIFGAWVAVFFLLLAIFSFLYKDNPFYKIAEHAYIGISAGYWLSIGFWTIIQPNLLGRLWPSKEYSEESFGTPFIIFLALLYLQYFQTGV